MSDLVVKPNVGADASKPKGPLILPAPVAKSGQSQITTPNEFRVEIVRGIDGLEPHIVAWNDLAANAIERNPFYEPWMMQPGVAAFGSGVDLCFYLIWQRNPRPNQPETLVGLFPFENCRNFNGLPFRRLKIWQHDYIFYCVPLVRRHVAHEVLHTLFDRMASGPSRVSMLEFHHIDSSGPFAQTLLDVTNDRAASTFTTDLYNRALFRPADSYDAYIATSMTNHNRQEIRRQRRRLEDQRALEVKVLNPGDNIDEWLIHFLELEAAGWKGHEQTALACDLFSRGYFETIARAAFARGQLMMVGLFLNEKPIAIKCNFLAGDGSFAFKIAFDETLAKYSPGVQLELENIRVLHEMPSLRWMDSCATRKHFMIGRLWSDRRTIQRMLVSTGRWSGNLAVDSIAILSCIRRTFRRSSKQTTSKSS